MSIQQKEWSFFIVIFNKEVLPEEIFLSWHSCPV